MSIRSIAATAVAIALVTAGGFAAGSATADDLSVVPGGTATAPPTPSASVQPAAPKDPSDHPAAAFQDEPDTAGAASPNGNAFSKPAVLTGYWPSFEFDSSAATVESGEPRALETGWYLQRTMWASWKAPASGWVTVSTTAGAADTGLNVYVGSKLTKLKRLAWNDEQYRPVDGASGSGDNGPSGGATVLSLQVKAGTVYRFQVGTPTTDPSKTPSVAGFSSVVLQVAANRYTSPNDFLSQAIELKATPGSSGNVYATALLNGATIEEWEPTDNPGGPLRTASVWYKWTAPVGGSTSIVACSAQHTPTVAAFTTHNSELNVGAGWGDLKAIKFDYNSYTCPAGTFGSYVSFDTVRGQTYYFQVAHAGTTDFPRLVDVQFLPFFAGPFIDGITKSGKAGTAVTIKGVNFDSGAGGIATVKFGNKSVDTIVGGADPNHVISIGAPKQSRKGSVAVTVTVDGVTSNPITFVYK